ncbi:MAG TPA: hypothetical protein VF473_09255, partial [Cyclobacteriaceae bacterium]
LNSLSRTNPELAPFVTPLIYLYSAFAISTWIVNPLSNLFLRLNVYGRYALTRDETRASTFTGIGFVITIFGAIGLLLNAAGPFFGMLIYGLGFMILCGSMFKPVPGNKRLLAMAVALGLSAIGALYLVTEFMGGDAADLFSIFLFGTIAYQFLVNALATR